MTDTEVADLSLPALFSDFEHLQVAVILVRSNPSPIFWKSKLKRIGIVVCLKRHRQVVNSVH